MEFNLNDISVLNRKVDPEVHKTPEARKLKEACQQFESILWAQVWKKMKTNAREMGGRSDEDRPWKQLEDLSLEMATEELTKSNHTGLWQQLYSDMIPRLAAAIKPDGVADSYERNLGEPESPAVSSVDYVG